MSTELASVIPLFRDTSESLIVIIVPSSRAAEKFISENDTGSITDWKHE